MLSPALAGRILSARPLQDTSLGVDLGTSANYPDVYITSSRERVLFEVLHILRHLDPPWASYSLPVTRNSPLPHSVTPTVPRSCIRSSNVKQMKAATSCRLRRNLRRRLHGRRAARS